MRWPALVLTIAAVGLAGGIAIAATSSGSEPGPETHCAMEIVAGDGSSDGAVVCFQTEAELNEAAGLVNPGLEASSSAPE